MKRSAAMLVVLLTASGFAQQTMSQTNPNSNASETQLKVDGTALYVRAIGNGQPIIVLHGGPDFDHSYLLPDLDRLKDRFRLIYYDQRGRGRSADKLSSTLYATPHAYRI